MVISTGLAGLMVALINRRRAINAIKRVQEENIENQGITRYSPSNIEAFFDENELVGNMAFSGGLNSIRCRAVTRAIECAYLQGFAIVVLHCNDQELENTFISTFGQQYINIVNAGGSYYDPFYGKSNNDINRLVLTSGTKDVKIESPGRYYLDAIGDFIRAKGILPYLNMYVTCPHMQLIDKTNEQESKGVFSSEQAQSIISKLMQGETERSNIEAFFERLSRQAGGLIPRYEQLQFSMNVTEAFQKKEIFSIDVQNAANSILINLVINEVEMELEAGRKVLVIIDNIALTSSEQLQELTKRSGSNCCIVVSSDDVFSLFNGDENSFYSFMGKSSKTILSKHASAYSCQKWSEYIGSYDKHEISTTLAQNSNYYKQWGLGSTTTANINIKRENIVQPETLSRMNVDEVYVINKNNGEIANTTIV